LRNLSSDNKQKWQAYYKKIEPEKFSDIIASFHADASSAKRPRAEQPVKKGGRFNLEDRLNNQDSFYDGADSSVDDVLDFDLGGNSGTTTMIQCQHKHPSSARECSTT
jgi:hypothetical protein